MYLRLSKFFQSKEILNSHSPDKSLFKESFFFIQNIEKLIDRLHFLLLVLVLQCTSKHCIFSDTYIALKYIRQVKYDFKQVLTLFQLENQLQLISKLKLTDFEVQLLRV